MKRLIEQTACDHGEFEAHQTYIKDRRGNIGAEGPVCPGGSSRELTVGYEAAALDIWNAIQGERPETWCRELARSSVDAALGSGL